MELDAWRCPECKRILAKVRLAPGSAVQVKCHSCGLLVTLDATGDVPTVRAERPLAMSLKL